VNVRAPSGGSPLAAWAARGIAIAIVAGGSAASGYA
jgi:hypothetical protein